MTLAVAEALTPNKTKIYTFHMIYFMGGGGGRWG